MNGEILWIQFGGSLTFGLEVNERIVGVTYWLDTAGIPPDADMGPLPDTGWYWVAVNSPRVPHRVAEGHELRADMEEMQLAQTVQAALEAVADEVLADDD